MNIVLGATGQIGFMLVNNLFNKGQSVRAVVRNEAKAYELRKIGVEVLVADYLDKESLIKAFSGGKTAFLLTPENPKSENPIDEVRVMINNYREAVKVSGIKKIIGLSSMGAQHESDTGNLFASYLMENAFSVLNIEQIFVRPAYYYSNWMGYLELIKTSGVLPTFFAPEMRLPMISPLDVAWFLADLFNRELPRKRIYEISGPFDYNSMDIAKIFEHVINRNVTLQQILPDMWKNTLEQAGFSANGVNNFALMIKAVVDGKTKCENHNPLRLSMDFQTYLERTL